MHYLPPETAPAEDREWSVNRVWPAAEGPLPVEVTPADAADAPLRAGWFHPAEQAGQGFLELLPSGEDPKLKALAEAARDGVVVSHRPAKRAVVRQHPDAGSVQFVKAVKRGKAAGILEGIRRAQAFDGPFRTPRVLTSDDSSVTFEALSGTSLHEADSFSPEEWTLAWAQVLEAWETTIQHPGELPEGTPVHDADAEIAVLRQWARQAQPFVSGFELLVETVEAAAHRLEEVPSGRVVPTHRDLHDKQLLWSAEHGPAVLDVDTACLAPPALDLANLRAHAHWRRRQGVWDEQQAGIVVRAVNDTAYRVGVSQDTMAAYEHATLLRLSCVYAFRPKYAALAEALRASLLAPG